MFVCVGEFQSEMGGSDLLDEKAFLKNVRNKPKFEG